MKKQDMHKVLQRGSLMVEALALLGLITMVTPVMYKKAAERTTELQDINIATQMRTLNEALDNYVRNNYNDVKTLVDNGDYKIVSATDSSNDIVKGVNAYLPSGFNLSQSKYFDANNLKFSIKREDDTDLSGNERSVYTTAVLAPSLNPITFNRASKIASMIGINGGTIKETKFEGAQGAWSADPSTWFGVTSANLKTGSLMSISNEAIAESAAADTSKLLYRVNDGDSVKNTMETNLLMGSKDIEQIGALFGQGGELTIGSDATNNSLIVKGAANISSTLKVTGETTLANTSVEGTLGVTGDTTLSKLTAGETTLANTSVEGTLGVTGTTTLANTSVTGTLGVTGATTLDSTLNVTGDTTLSKLSAGETDLTSLAVANDATVGGNLTIGGTLISNNLHAKTKLTVGGEDPDNPSVMTVDSNTFNVENSAGSINLGSSKFEVAHSSGNKVTINEEDLTAYAGTSSDGSAAKLQLKNTGTVKLTGNTGSLNIGEKIYNAKNNRSHIAMGGKNGGEIGVTIDRLVSGKWHDSVYLKNFTVNDDDSVTENGSLVIDFDKLNLKHGVTELKMQENGDGSDEVAISVHGRDILSSFADIIAGSTTLASPTQQANIDLQMNTISARSSNFYLDGGGLAIGENLTESGGNRNNPITNPLTAQSNQKVIISRNGYIELAPPSEYGTSGANDGTKAGFIRARRLVSDIPYYNHEHFQGATYDGYEVEHPYDYYQVNPAYTSIMNDIKLASRGGARLSDILSDYIIKGIYVGDNTYHAGYSKDEGFDIENKWVSGLNSDALIWDVIPIEKGAVKSDVIKANDVTGNTSCAPIDQTGDTPNPNCTIYSCQTADCVASPWMGFVPKPQCPEHYLAVVTNNPIRWRMSEVYYLYNDGSNDLATLTDQKAYNIIIKDLKSQMDEGDPQPADTERFSYYFKKHNDPKEAFFSIEEAEGNTPHTHKTSATPITFQTNTWLNSSVSPHISSDGGVDGWHVLMGFLYKPNDYAELLADTGLDGADSESIHWNIFPVYAHEMASIVTTYCAFAPTAGNRWDSDNTESPVLNYNQLNSNTFRDPNLLNREPVNGTTGKGEGWAKQVNDPSLPYDDAW